MLDLGTVRPGSTIYIPVNTFSSDDPSASVTATNWANTDCHVHKDGGTTQRGSSAGETLTIDFDSIAGNHLLAIDLADNTTANFYEAGSIYHVRIEGVTVDGATINSWIAQWRIGYPGALLDTTIATLASQTSFTLEDGSADDDAYNGWVAVIHDLASAVQVALGYVSDYTGSTKTVTLAGDPGIFTMAAGDNISLFPPAQVAGWNGVPLATTNPLPNAAADAAGGLPVSDTGGLDLDAEFAKLGTPTDLGGGATLADNNADMAGGTFDPSTDSQEAIRDRGDAEWATATGFSTHSAADVVDEWETQSQADPTGFHVNVKEVNGTAQTAGDLAALLATIDGIVDSILADTGTDGVVIADGAITAAKIAAAAITAAKFAAGAIDAAAVATDAAEEIATAVKAAGIARLSKNTAFANFMFKMVDETDLKTAETGLTVTATRSIDGAAFGAAANSVTELSNGWYIIDLAASDLNGDSIVLRFTATGAADREYQIITNPLS